MQKPVGNASKLEDFVMADLFVWLKNEINSKGFMVKFRTKGDCGCIEDYNQTDAREWLLRQEISVVHPFKEGWMRKYRLSVSIVRYDEPPRIRKKEEKL